MTEQTKQGIICFEKCNVCDKEIVALSPKQVQAQMRIHKTTHTVNIREVNE